VTYYSRTEILNFSLDFDSDVQLGRRPPGSHNNLEQHEKQAAYENLRSPRRPKSTVKDHQELRKAFGKSRVNTQKIYVFRYALLKKIIACKRRSRDLFILVTN
jgi:hypothetical protein